MYWRIFTMTENKTVLAWLEEMKAMCQPDNVVWIDGSEEQLEALRAEAVETGEMIIKKSFLDVTITEQLKTT